MKAYKIYTVRNLADTIRDHDDIVTTELGYTRKLEVAIHKAKDYIANSFFHKDTDLKKSSDGSYSATDFCSYGATIRIEVIDIE